MSEQSDPRQRGFTAFSLQPPQAPAADERQARPELRGISGPPPTKPPVSRRQPGQDTQGEPSGGSSASSQPIPRPRPASPHAQDRSRSDDIGPGGRLGSPRHHMRYVQFQVAPHLSDLLSARAEQEDVVLGQVVIDAVRKFDALSDTAKSQRRRRHRASAVRRSVLVRPVEADEIKAIAGRHGFTSSALIRMALESYLQ